MKLKHLESALQSVTTYSELGTDKVNIDLEQYRYRGKQTLRVQSLLVLPTALVYQILRILQLKYLYTPRYLQIHV